MTPPKITPDWTPLADRVGDKRFFMEANGATYSQLHRYFVQDDAEHEANTRFFSAAKQMADALVLAHESLLTLETMLFMPENENSAAGKCRAALLAAGYTE